jgi:hypothetical protein
MKPFEMSIFCEKTRKYIDCIFLCKKSEAKHKKLKTFANNEPYWFEGLHGAEWQRGGFYQWNYGFINPHFNLKNNVQGVVYENEVYLLKKIITK